MIVGIGVDIVDIARFDRAVRRTPALLPRLFLEHERNRSNSSLAARFAAKEALIKALGEIPGFRWLDMSVDNDEHGNPGITATGRVAEALATRHITHLHLSMTHDAGIACAFVVAERVT